MQVQKAVKAKNPKTVKLTKKKGHATEEMVEDDRVRREDKEGNDEADQAAENGVTEEQGELNHLGWKYAARLKAYTRFMDKAHSFIVKVRKGTEAADGEESNRKGPVWHEGNKQEDYATKADLWS